MNANWSSLDKTGSYIVPSHSVISSQGLMGLPHYRNSKISTDLGEPIYENLFTFQISLPDSLIPVYGKDTVSLLHENITKVSGLDTWKVPDAGVTQSYKFAKRKFASSGPTDTTTTLNLDIQLNIMYTGSGASMSPDLSILKLLRAWTDLVYNPLTGLQGIKLHYIAPQAVLTVHDREYNPFWQWTMYNLFPTKGLTADFDYNNGTNILAFNGFTLQCDYWDEAILGDGSGK